MCRSYVVRVSCKGHRSLNLEQSKGGLKGHSRSVTISGTESHLKMMKNAFYFILKALFVLKILKFLSSIFVLVLKDKVNFKIYDVATLFNLTQPHTKYKTSLSLTQPVSRIKGNQIKKFGQFIEYVMSNTFLEKSYAKCSGETIPFLKNQN